MKNIKEILSIEKTQTIAFLSLSLFIIVSTVVLFFLKTEKFKSFFGNINPILVVSLVIIVGFVTLTFLRTKDYFQIFKIENLKQIPISALVAIIFCFGAIIIDVLFPYAEDINLALPKSLLFYPTMGFVVEILFHVIPLTLLLVLHTTLFKNTNQDLIILICVIIVSVLEPIFQYIFSTAVGQPIGIKLFDVLRLFLFSFVQLYIFKYNDFMSMYIFRMIYYLFWHIIWGTFRLKVLF